MKKAAVPVAILAAASLYPLLQPHDGAEGENPGPLATSIEIFPPAGINVESKQAAAPMPNPTGETGPLSQAIRPPDMETLRQEAARDPHTPPASYINFSRQIAERMGRARHSVSDAHALFDELSRCAVQDRSLTPQVQTLCMANASQLTQAFPEEFRDRYLSLTEEASPEVIRLLDSVNRLAQ